jgi:hypothetical protein
MVLDSRKYGIYMLTHSCELQQTMNYFTLSERGILQAHTAAEYSIVAATWMPVNRCRYMAMS